MVDVGGRSGLGFNRKRGSEFGMPADGRFFRRMYVDYIKARNVGASHKSLSRDYGAYAFAGHERWVVEINEGKGAYRFKRRSEVRGNAEFDIAMG